MATDLEKLVVSLEANLKQFEKEMARANNISVKNLRNIEKEATKTSGRIEKAMGKVGSSFKSFGAGFIGGIFGGMSVDAIVSGINEVVHSVAALADQAKKAGVSAEALQAYGFVASQSGSSVEELADSFVQLNKRVGEAVRNGGDLKDLFDANNLTFSDSAVENMLKVSGLIQNARSEIDKATIANLAFGRSGAELIQYLEQGPEALRQQANEARNTGHVIDGELVAKAKEFDDAWSAVWHHFSTLAKATILDVAKDLANLGLTTEDALAGTSNDAIAKRLASAQEELANLKKQLDDGVSGRVKFAIEQKIKQLESLIAVLERANAAVDVNREGKGDMLPVPNAGGAAPRSGAPYTNIPSKSDIDDTVSKAAKRGILELIGSVEGTDKGRGYNESLGYGRFTGGNVSLVTMTLAQIKALQTQMLAQTRALPKSDPLYNSSAVGRYQITRSTLEDFQRKLGLSDNELFSPEIQDKIANAIIAQTGGDIGKLRGRWEGFNGRGISDDTIRTALDSSAGPISSSAEDLRERANAYDELIQKSKEARDGMQLETDLIGKSTYETERARKEAELLAEAKKEGLELTPERLAGIEGEAEAWGKVAAAQDTAQQKYQQLVDAQQQAQAQAQEFSSAVQSSLKGFVSDLVHGKSATEALGNALQSLADRLLDMALDSIFDNIFGGGSSGGGGIGGILSALLGGGTAPKAYAKGGIARKASIAGEAGPEAVVPLPDGRSIPVQMQMPDLSALRSASRRDGLDIKLGMTTDGNGNLMPFVESVVRRGVRQGLTVYDKSLSQSFGARMARAQGTQL